MKTITFAYNSRSKLAKAIIALIEASDDVKIIESPYEQDFVAKIKQSEKSKKRCVKASDVWK
mgnify:CR=1 FL=1